MTLNDVIQWSSVIAILVIVIVTVVRKIVRFNRSIGSDAESNCRVCNGEERPRSMSACDSCNSDCPLRG